MKKSCGDWLCLKDFKCERWCDKCCGVWLCLKDIKREKEWKRVAEFGCVWKILSVKDDVIRVAEFGCVWKILCVWDSVKKVAKFGCVWKILSVRRSEKELWRLMWWRFVRNEYEGKLNGVVWDWVVGIYCKLWIEKVRKKVVCEKVVCVELRKACVVKWSVSLRCVRVL